MVISLAFRHPRWGWGHGLLGTSLYVTPDNHLVFKWTTLCITYHLLCRCLYISRCSHGKGFLRFQSPSSDQQCGSLHSQASGIWQPPAPLYCPPQGHTCRAQPSQSGPGRKDAHAWSEMPQPGPAGHTQRRGLFLWRLGRAHTAWPCRWQAPTWLLPPPCALPYLANMPSLLLLLC